MGVHTGQPHSQVLARNIACTALPFMSFEQLNEHADHQRGGNIGLARRCTVYNQLCWQSAPS